MTMTVTTAASPVTPYGYFASVVGIDPSLASTGVAILYPDGRKATHHITSTGKRADTLADRRQRIRGIREQLSEWIGSCDLVVIEGPSHGSRGGSPWDRAGLWWALIDIPLAMGGPVVQVAPSTRAKWAAGSGRADKAAVAAAMQRRCPEVELTNSDEADALAFACMGGQYLGWLSATKADEAALAGVKSWPEPRS